MDNALIYRLSLYIYTIHRFDGPENGNLWGLSSTEDVLVRPPGASMAFADFVQLLRAKGIDESFYLEYLATHQYLGRALTVRSDCVLFVLLLSFFGGGLFVLLFCFVLLFVFCHCIHV